MIDCLFAVRQKRFWSKDASHFDQHTIVWNDCENAMKINSSARFQNEIELIDERPKGVDEIHR